MEIRTEAAWHGSVVETDLVGPPDNILDDEMALCIAVWNAWWLFSRSVVSDSLPPHGLQHAKLPCPSPSPRVYWNSCALSRWCHPTISSSVLPFSSRLQSFPASGSFPVSPSFAPGGQSVVALPSEAVLPGNIQDWLPLGWTDWSSLQSKGLSRAFSNTKGQKQ